VPFTVIGVAPPEFFGVDVTAAPEVYLPLHTNVLVDGARETRLPIPHGATHFTGKEPPLHERHEEALETASVLFWSQDTRE